LRFQRTARRFASQNARLLDNASREAAHFATHCAADAPREELCQLNSWLESDLARSLNSIGHDDAFIPYPGAPDLVAFQVNDRDDPVRA
jgi:hypothetical protein